MPVHFTRTRGAAKIVAVVGFRIINRDNRFPDFHEEKLSQHLHESARLIRRERSRPFRSFRLSGDRLFLNDGLVQLLVDQVEVSEVHCTVAVGGELRSRKGLNLPRINLGISAFTDHDRKCLEFALACGIDAVSQSFVESAADIKAVRAAAAALGKSPFPHRQDRALRIH